MKKMENEKELNILNSEEQEIKPFEGKKGSYPVELGLELLTNVCPLSCKSCKTVYSNKVTGMRIVCKCSCHHIENRDVI
jgi:hypothetical protein